MNNDLLGAQFLGWAKRNSSIGVVLLLGSRARQGIGERQFDNRSDWDFQVISNSTKIFLDRSWSAEAGLGDPLAYVVRPGRLKRVTKVSAVFREGELDIIILPLRRLQLARLLLNLNATNLNPSIAAAFSELSMVLQPGYQLIKGGSGWRRFFEKLVQSVPPTRLTNNDVVNLAEGFVCDYVLTTKRLLRGECLAAQRWLHLELAEVNFRLLHELRLRNNISSFPDARRIEFLKADRWREAVTISAHPIDCQISASLEKSASTLRALASALGCDWAWPQSVPTSISRGLQVSSGI